LSYWLAPPFKLTESEAEYDRAPTMPRTISGADFSHRMEHFRLDDRQVVLLNRDRHDSRRFIAVEATQRMAVALIKRHKIASDTHWIELPIVCATLDKHVKVTTLIVLTFQ
jgi:hypothetical protein